jgi:hypothetical protein
MILEHNGYLAEVTRDAGDHDLHGVVLDGSATLHFAGRRLTTWSAPLPIRLPITRTGAVSAVKSLSVRIPASLCYALRPNCIGHLPMPQQRPESQ